MSHLCSIKCWLCTAIVTAVLLLVPGSSPQEAQASEAVWEWQNPLPQGNDLRAVWGSSANDVFAGGDYETLLHYDGATWSSMPSGITARLDGVWGSSGSDVFVVGVDGTILHYDGAAWSAMDSGTTERLFDVWGSSGTDVFAVGSFGTILHYDGASWTAMEGGTGNDLRGVWGSSGTDVFAVGSSRTILHYDGISWTAMENSSGSFVDVWGSSGQDVYTVADYGGQILHYDGTDWSETGFGPGFPNCIWGSSSTDVYVAGGTTYHYDGTAWVRVEELDGQDIYDIWGGSETDIFAVGRSGFILHFDGASWSEMSSGLRSELRDIWGSSETDVFAVGYFPDAVLHYDGSSWSAMEGCTENIDRGIWGRSGSDVFAVGRSGTIVHYDGTSWTAMESGTGNALSGVWGSSGTDVFAVGESGTVLHYDGTSWTAMESGAGNALNGVWGSSGTDVFAVGNFGTILHYDGSSWTAMVSGTGNGLEGIWGSSGSDVFAVGYANTILHYDGSSWTAIETGTTYADFAGVWGRSSDDVFIVGGWGMVLHYDGTEWCDVRPATGRHAYGVWGNAGHDIFVVGAEGAILHYPASSSPPLTYSISGHVDDANGDPVEGVTIWAGFPYGAVTASDGSYTITGLPADTYEVRPSLVGEVFTPAVSTVVVVDSDVRDVSFEKIDKVWTLMYYLAADNSSYGTVRWEYDEILPIAAQNSLIRIAVFIDSPSSGAHYVVFAHNGTIGPFDKGELNTGDPQTLIDFVNWVRSDYPGGPVALIISDHGHALSGVAVDTTSGGDWLTPRELQQALQQTGPLDVLFLNTCLMANLEIAYQLRGLAGFYVASEAQIWLPSLHDSYCAGINEDTSAQDLAKSMARSYEDTYGSLRPGTISVVRFDQLENVASSASALAEAIQDQGPITKLQIWNQTSSDVLQRFDESGTDRVIDDNDRLADLYDFAVMVAQFDDLQDEAMALLDALDDYIIYEGAWSLDVTVPGTNRRSYWDHDDAHGVSVAMPRSPISFYRGDWLDFAQGTDWAVGSSASSVVVSEEAGFGWGPMLVDLIHSFNPDAPGSDSPPEPMAPLDGRWPDQWHAYLPVVLATR